MSTDWIEGSVDGCIVRLLQPFRDERGWLAEFFRQDELPAELHPEMGYLSLTHPGVARGPHEHRKQTDLFFFFSGIFRLYLWDPRAESPTSGNRIRADLGAAQPAVVIVPPGVVHAYRNVGDDDAYIINCPNRLYRGRGRNEQVDEIRHEHREDSPYILD